MSRVPDEGPEGGGAQPHVAFDPQEADEERGDALHQPQVVELFGVFGVDLLQTRRGQGSFIRAPVLWLRLHGDLLPVVQPTRPQVGTMATKW